MGPLKLANASVPGTCTLLDYVMMNSNEVIEDLSAITMSNNTKSCT